jgi:hypothetical protein
MWWGTFVIPATLRPRWADIGARMAQVKKFETLSEKIKQTGLEV